MTTATADRSPASETPPTLGRLIAAKTVANTALRWVSPFLPTLERAFGATTSQLTTVLGAGEIAGLTTVLVGGQLDRRRERTIMVAGLTAIALSSIIALVGALWSFAVAFVLLILGVANFTVAGHAWISDRVDYRWRARSIGLFETSWALALLVGGPVIAVLINAFGWRGPFVTLAVLAGASAVMLAVSLPSTPSHLTPALRTDEDSRTGLNRRAWFVVAASALMAMGGLSVFVISGAWLDDQFGVSTGGLGYIVMGFGAIELVASSSTAAFADRIGKRPSTLGGLMLVGVGLAIMVSAGSSLLIGVIGILVFLLGFEYGFVTSLSLISEAMPEARGRTLAVGNAIGTLARGSGTIASGWLYDAHGIAGTAALSATASAVSFVLFLGAGRPASADVDDPQHV